MKLRDKKVQIRQYWVSCLSGLDGWREGLMLTSLLTLLCVLLLNSPGMDAQIVRLLHWFGSNCNWCTSLQN